MSDQETIDALMAERDQIRAALERLRRHIVPTPTPANLALALALIQSLEDKLS